MRSQLACHVAENGTCQSERTQWFGAAVSAVSNAGDHAAANGKPSRRASARCSIGRLSVGSTQGSPPVQRALVRLRLCPGLADDLFTDRRRRSSTRQHAPMPRSARAVSRSRVR